jgi:transglutaminase-like putative cysteine protease
MRKLTDSKGGKHSTAVRHLALSLVADLPPKDYAAEVCALHAFVRDRIRYVRDIVGTETVQTPERTIINEAGDCDDKSTLLASLLEAIGVPTRFEAVGFTPGHWSHVLVQALLKNRWVSLETTVNVQPGWRPPGVVESLTVGA